MLKSAWTRKKKKQIPNKRRKRNEKQKMPNGIYRDFKEMRLAKKRETKRISKIKHFSLLISFLFHFF